MKLHIRILSSFPISMNGSPFLIEVTRILGLSMCSRLYLRAGNGRVSLYIREPNQNTS